mmetsp:Transcript_81391/g.141264  ORF Transcript_81391/g.141264 Transcript_81391/m.141264 type:complete len:301 (+) Transcript_81391:66-968(+)
MQGAKFRDRPLGPGKSQAQAHVVARSDAGLTAFQHSAAGAAANAAVKLVVYPLDTWKSRLQARHLGALGDFAGMWTVRSMYRGMMLKLALHSPYQALYMAVYVHARGQLLAAPQLFGGNAMTFVVAGATAEIVGSLVRLPMEVAKLRLQTGLYQNSLHAFQDFCRKPSSFYRHFVPQTLMHDCIYSACSWMFFESARQRLFQYRDCAELQHHENLMLGAAVGAVSAWVTTPFDVVRTRIIAPGQGRSSPVLPMVRSIWCQEGAGAFWRGGTLRVAHVAPGSGFYMFFYEALKMRILTWQR